MDKTLFMSEAHKMCAHMSFWQGKKNQQQLLWSYTEDTEFNYPELAVVYDSR